VSCEPGSITQLTHVVVTAAVIERDGTFLLTRRLEGTHLAGCWEFPGGKCNPGETLGDCLTREIREELDAEIDVGEEILATTHDYADRRIELRFFRCVLKTEPRAVFGQEMQWVRREALCALDLPPADDELVKLLTQTPLPE
jgi:mutator protein MutT